MRKQDAPVAAKKSRLGNPWRRIGRRIGRRFGPGAVFALVMASGLIAEEITLRLDEATQPSLSVSPDGATVYFQLLGDLVAVPAEGGEARVLTRGSAYDSWPLPSDDGKALYFLSDREAWRPEVHRLDLKSGEVERLTDLGLDLTELGVAGDGSRFGAVVRRAGRDGFILRHLPGGERPVMRVPPNLRRPTFVLDGSVVVVERSSTGGSLVRAAGRKRTTIYRPGEGRRIDWASVDSRGGRAVLLESGPWQEGRPDFEELLIVELDTGEVILRRSNGPARVGGGSDRAGFAMDRVFFPARDGIQVFHVPTGKIEPLRWSATLRFEVPDRHDEPRRDPGAAGVELVLQGLSGWAVSPEADEVVFSMVGDLYRKTRGKDPVRLTRGQASDTLPFFIGEGKTVYFARDGSLCRISREGGGVENLEIPVATEYADSFFPRPDGTAIVNVGSFRSPGVVEVDLATKKARTRVAGEGRWATFPEYGSAGEVVFAQERRGAAQVYALHDGSEEPRQITDLARPPRRAAASRDGRHLAVLRDGRVHLASRKKGALISEEDLRPLGEIGAHSMAFSADSTAVFVGVGTRITSYDCATSVARGSWDLSLRERAEPAAPPLRIFNVNVIDVETGKIRKDAEVLIAKGAIERIGPSTGRSPGNERMESFDAKEGFLVPGLFDMHVHELGDSMAAMIAYGVTTVRQLGSPWPAQRALLETVRLGRTVGPDALSAGDLFEGPVPIWGNLFFAIDSEAEGLGLLDRRIEEGIDVVKIYPSLPRSLRRPLIDRAIARGVPTTVHVSSLREVVSCISDGIGCLEHYPERVPLLRGDCLALMAATGVAWCPTLCVRGGGDAKWRLTPGELEDPLLRKAVPSTHLRRWRSRAKVDAGDDGLRSLVLERCRTLARAVRSGVQVIVGSDCSVGNALVGPSTHWEMEFLVQGGLPPLAALQAATVVPARLYGLTDRGSVREGARADLVLLRENPLENIRATRNIQAVIRRGRLRIPAELLGDQQSR